MSGAQIMIEALHAEGVKYVFGYPGGAVLPIYDEIYKQKYFKHILVRHEQAAAHAADAYARTTDEVGVVLVTSGPGATNAVTGIATAYADSIPLVVFTGQVGTKLIGTDAFQEVDTVGITRPCVKHNFLVTDVRELADTIKKAFYLARSGRPGPVLIDIPKDVQCAKCPFVYPEVCDIPGYRPVLKGHPGQIKRALQVLLTAKRPVVYIGGGMNNPRAAELLARFVELTGFPVASTLMGLGALDAGSKLNLGMLGMHGTYEANMAMHNSDVVLALGARFDDRVIGNPRDFEGLPRTVVQVDVDPSSISKCVATHVPIVGDVRDVLSQMVEQLEATSTRSDSEALGKWIAQIEKWRAKRSLAYSAPEGGA
ncbi:MAG TPA: acetolactate synthase 3 large subunit, partial [Sutterella sp.]|nr:acetolactate synthase 3 large subunit [Sutterella sp.]